MKVYITPEGDGFTLRPVNAKSFLGKVPNFDSIFEANQFCREWDHEVVATHDSSCYEGRHQFQNGVCPECLTVEPKP